MRRSALTIVATVVGLVLLLQFKTHPGSATTNGLTSLAAVPGTTSHARARSNPHHHTASATPRATHSNQSRRAKPTTITTTKPSKPQTITATGQTAQTRYGPVQVRIVETAGRLTDITAIQLPGDNSHSSEIASYATPILRSEALRANSAHIDIVSGATYTSDGYAQSLQSALDNA